MSYKKIKSYAKINLALNIISKIKSLHRIESIVAFVDLYDVILSLHAMFDDPDNAMNVYATYKKTYKKFGGDSISTTDASQFNKFFKT